jgi:HEAT repeat protein
MKPPVGVPASAGASFHKDDAVVRMPRNSRNSRPAKAGTPTTFRRRPANARVPTSPRHLLCLGLSLLFAFAGCQRHPPPAPATPAPQPSETIRAALDHPIYVDFYRKPLPDVLAELSKQTGLSIQADEAGLGAGRADWSLDQWRVTLRAADMRLDSALALIADAFDVHLTIRQTGIVLAPAAAAPPALHTVIYPLPAAWCGSANLHPAASGRRFTADDLAALLPRFVAPNSWDTQLGPGHVRAMPGAIVVAQTPTVQRQVADFLAGLRALDERGQAASQASIEARRSPATARIIAALASPVTLDIHDMPLIDFLAQLAEVHGINIVAQDLGFNLSEWDFENRQVSIKVSNHPLEVVLTQVLNESGMLFHVRHEALVLQYSALDRASWRLLPVPADTLAALACGSSDDPTRLLTRHVNPRSWAIVGGPAQVAVVPGGLAVLQTYAGHEPAVERFLRTVTQALDPTHVGDAPPLTPGELEIEQALDRAVSVNWQDQSLRQGLTELFTSAGLTRYHIDTVSIEDSGIDPDEGILSLQLRDVPLRSALAIIEGQGYLQAWLDDETLSIAGFEGTDQVPQFARCYRVSAIVGPGGGLDEEVLIELITHHTEPYAWDDVGGPAAIEALPGLLVVTADSSTHRQIRYFLDGLTQLVARPLAVDDPRALPAPSMYEARVYAALAEPATLNVDDQPLDEVLAQLAARHGLTGKYLLDLKALEDAGLAADTPASAHVADVPLAAALTALLRPLALHWSIRHDVLWIATHEYLNDTFQHSFYPLPWISELSHAAITADALVDAVEQIDVAQWYGYGKGGQIDAVPGGLVVTHALRRNEIGRFLEDISLALTGRRHPVLPAYASVFTSDAARDFDNDLLVHDLRPLLAPAGPWTADELIELVAALPHATRDNQPVVLAGIFLAAPSDAQARDWIEQLLTDRDGCRMRIARLRRAAETDQGLAACRAALVDPSPVVRCQALALLAEMGAGARPAVPEIIALLADGEWRVRYAAIQSLATAGPAPDLAAAPLAELLRDENDDLSRAAAYTLEGFGPEAAPALPVLRELLESDDKPVPRTRWLPIIKAMRSAAAPLLGQQMEHQTSQFLLAYDVLKEFGPDAAPAVPHLAAALRTDLVPDRRHLICELLAGLGPAAESAIPDLIAVAQTDVASREWTCVALAAIGRQPETVVPVLEQLLFDRNSAAVRQEACQSLGQFGPDAAPALPALRRAAADDSMEFVRGAAAIAIQRIESPPPATPKGKQNQGAAP